MMFPADLQAFDPDAFADAIKVAVSKAQADAMRKAA